MTTKSTEQPPRGVTRQSGPQGQPGRRAALTIRLDFGTHAALGPGKVRLLELVGELGSIAAAGKAMGMSYRRAWLLIDSLNRAFSEPLVQTQTGGARGGGAGVTALGRNVISRYRTIEKAAARSAAGDLAAITAMLAADAPDPLPQDDGDQT